MKEDTEHKPKAIFEIVDHGPMKIKGKFILKDAKRNKEESSEEMLLCLCGRSNNKPYCDCSHEK